jgi:hypothetical protein
MLKLIFDLGTLLIGAEGTKMHSHFLCAVQRSIFKVLWKERRTARKASTWSGNQLAILTDP